MSLLRPFTACDLFRCNNINLDCWTETYDISFYLSYLSKWPDLFLVEVAGERGLLRKDKGTEEDSAPGAATTTTTTTTTDAQVSRLMGYVMGKVEGRGRDLHGHVTCITVAPEYRFLQVAKRLMVILQAVSEEETGYHGYFVDLFVRVSNVVAIGMYKGMGYTIYRRVVNYYRGGVRGGHEDGFDMRIPLKRDTTNSSIRGGSEDRRVRPEDCFF